MDLSKLSYIELLELAKDVKQALNSLDAAVERHSAPNVGNYNVQAEQIEAPEILPIRLDTSELAEKFYSDSLKNDFAINTK